jgi:hypothetical protein
MLNCWTFAGPRLAAENWRGRVSISGEMQYLVSKSRCKRRNPGQALWIAFQTPCGL